MIYLGIDPGTHRIGYGVIRSEAQRMVPVAYGIIENKGNDRGLNISNVERSLAELIDTHEPVAIGIEKLFFATNRKTAMAVSEMRGVILAGINRYDIPVHEFTPLQIKQAVCGYGKADKAQVQHMVGMILSIKEKIRPDDAADALAIALCCSSVPNYLRTS